MLLRCAYCHDPAPLAGLLTCPGCATRVHAECDAEALGCPTLGCVARPCRPAPERPQRAATVGLFTFVVAFLATLLGAAVGASEGPAAMAVGGYAGLFLGLGGAARFVRSERGGQLLAAGG